MRIQFFFRIVLLCSFTLVFINSTSAQCNVPIRVSGANAAAITPGMNQLRSEIGGVNNGAGGTFTTGYREVNWDISGMPTSFPIPRDYYNDPVSGISKGLVLDGSFDVSQAYVSGSTAPLLFGDINPSYSTEFLAFSSPRLLGITAGTSEYPGFVEFSFFVPGTKTPATVNGFGMVFTDVDDFSSATITFFGTDGLPILTTLSVGPLLTTPPADKGLSFVGVACTKRIARVRIKAGHKILAAVNTDSVPVDVVAMDDFIYGEPKATNSYAKPADFKGDGFSDFVIFRNGTWFVFNNPTFTVSIYTFGQPCDIPIDGDFDGDNIADLAIYRKPGDWWIQPSSGGPTIFRKWGSAGDIPITGDYNGDGKTDIAVWRPGPSGNFYVLLSPDFTTNTMFVTFGTTTSTFPVYSDFPFVAAADPCPPY